jgi:carboxymethylenebutenolidase
MIQTKSDYIQIAVADGSTMLAYTAVPENINTNTPAIIVLQEAFGVNHHIRNIAERFAQEGYVTIAPELFHRTAPEKMEGSYNDFPAMLPHYNALTNEGLTADLQAAYQWLTQQNVNTDAVFSVGYCLGGKVSFLANAVLPLKASVSYYGGGVDQLASEAVNLHGRHLFYWGGKDQHIKTENINTIIQAVEDAGKEYVNVKFSYADHGFNCDERASYNETAAKEAWALTLAFLKSN